MGQQQQQQLVGSNKEVKGVSKTSFPEATWPEALPHAEEDCYFSVAMFPMETTWCMHYRSPQASCHVPAASWRWDCDIKHPDFVRDSRHAGMWASTLPDAVLATYLDPSLTKDAKAIADWLVQRKRIPAITIYVIHSSPRHAAVEARNIRFFMGQLPCRFYQLSWNQFLPHQPHMARLSTRIAAALKAITAKAEATQGSSAMSPAPAAASTNTNDSDGTGKNHDVIPVAWIHAGTCLSYTATNRKGVVIGEGIIPNVRELSESLGETDWDVGLRSAVHALPATASLAKGRKKDSSNGTSADTASPCAILPLFSGNSITAHVCGIMCCIQGTLYSILKGWLAELQISTPESTTATAKELQIWITGEHGPLVRKLLQPSDMGSDDAQWQMFDSTGLGELFTQQGTKCSIVSEYRALEHYGVHAMLEEKRETHPTLHDVGFQAIVGQRVAKKSGSNVLYGTVLSMRKNDRESFPFNAEYQVLYDNLETAILGTREIHVALSDFCSLKKESGRKTGLDKVSDARVIRDVLALELRNKSIAEMAATGGKGENNFCITTTNITPANARTSSDTPAPKRRRPDGSDYETPLAKKSASGDTDDRDLDLEAPRSSERKPNSILHDDWCRSFIGMRIAKFFDDPKVPYFGTLTEFSPARENDSSLDLWRVNYDDGDSEDFEDIERKKFLKLYEKHKDMDTAARPTK